MPPPKTDEQKLLQQEHRAEAALLVRRACEPVSAGERIGRQIERAAKALEFSYRRTEDLWRKEARRVDSWELEWMRTLPKRAKRERR